MNTHKLHILLQWATALLVVSAVVLTILGASISYLYLVALVFTLNHLFVGLESIILDYVHGRAITITSFLILIRVCSLSLLIISTILVFLG